MSWWVRGDLQEADAQFLLRRVCHSPQSLARPLMPTPPYLPTLPHRFHNFADIVCLDVPAQIVTPSSDICNRPTSSPLHSFHRFANIIYLDAPAFVGFSYSQDECNRKVGGWLQQTK